MNCFCQYLITYSSSYYLPRQAIHCGCYMLLHKQSFEMEDGAGFFHGDSIWISMVLLD